MIRLQLITLSGTLFDDDVYEVLLPTMSGQIGVLGGHMPLISAATHGIISIRRAERDSDSDMEHFATNGGVVDVDGHTVRVIVDEADSAENISESEAQAAYERAQMLMAEATDEVSLEKAQQLVDRTAVRLQVAGLKRRSNRR